MTGSRTKEKTKRGRPSLCDAQKTKRHDCDSKSGKAVCVMAVACDYCEICLRGCASNKNCTEMRPQESKKVRKLLEG